MVEAGARDVRENKLMPIFIQLISCIINSKVNYLALG